MSKWFKALRRWVAYHIPDNWVNTGVYENTTETLLELEDGCRVYKLTSRYLYMNIVTGDTRWKKDPWANLYRVDERGRDRFVQLIRS